MSIESATSKSALEDERQLIFLAQNGDREAFGTLFVRHSQAVRRLLRSVLGPGCDIDDLTQDVFVQVYRSIKKFKGEAQFGTWLHRLTLNVAISQMRQNKRQVLLKDERLIDHLADDGERDVHDHWVAKEMVRRFYAVFRTLTPKRQTAFALFAIEGRSIAEAAAIVNVPVALMKSRIWFARRELLKKAGDDPYLRPLLSEMSP